MCGGCECCMLFSVLGGADAAYRIWPANLAAPTVTAAHDCIAVNGIDRWVELILRASTEHLNPNRNSNAKYGRWMETIQSRSCDFFSQTPHNRGAYEIFLNQIKGMGAKKSRIRRCGETVIISYVRKSSKTFPKKKKNANEVEIDAWINFGEAFTVEWSLVLSLATKFGGKNEFSWKKKANDGPVLTKWVWRRSRQTAAIDIVAEREVITIGGCGRLRVACQKLDYATRSSSCFGFLSLRVQCVSSVSRCSLLRTSPYYTRNACYAIAVLITATATDHFFFFNFPLFAWKHGKRVPK